MKFKINDDEWTINEISNAEMNSICESDNKETFTHGYTQYSDLTISINKDSHSKRKTLIHELTHCWLYEYGHNQWSKEFNYEDVCEIVSASNNFINKIVEDYFNNSNIIVDTSTSTITPKDIKQMIPLNNEGIY